MLAFEVRALALAEGGDPGMAICTELTNAMVVTATMDETVFFGINANTLSMDVRAWDMWEHECRTQGTSPLRVRPRCDSAGEPYSHHFLHSLLRAALTHLYGPAVASLYSFHAFRSGLIQLICRWMCPESLHVYRRMGVAENEINVRKASTFVTSTALSRSTCRQWLAISIRSRVRASQGHRRAAILRASPPCGYGPLDPFQARRARCFVGGPSHFPDPRDADQRDDRPVCGFS